MSECYDWTDEPAGKERRVFSQLQRLDDGRWAAVFEPAVEAPIASDTPRAALAQAIRTLGDRACALERGLAELDRIEQEWRRAHTLRSLRGGTLRSELRSA